MSCEDNNNEQKDCTLSAFERNRYFYGKLMTVRDFKAEQDYFNGKRHMLNRLIHGVGIVCGLEVTGLNATAGKLTVNLNKGVALDCCGREIVMPLSGEEIKVSGTLTDGELNYLYLKYKECPTEKVPSASNSSACDEVCCDNRMRETFLLEVNTAKPDTTPECDKTITKEAIKSGVQCSVCNTNDPKVLIGVLVNDGINWKRDDNETLKCRSMVFSNPILYKLINCHLNDDSNPHNVTAQQVDNEGETNMLVTQINAGSGVINARHIDDSITRDSELKAHTDRKDNPHEVTALQTRSLVSVNRVSNPGGNVDLLAGANITIAPDDAGNSIMISSTASIDPAGSVTSVGQNKVVGIIDRYAREDHVHKLEDGVVGFKNLEETLRGQLDTVFMYLRERALKCAVMSFKEVGIKFKSEAAQSLSIEVIKLVDTYAYKDPNKFAESLNNIIADYKDKFIDEIKKQVEENSLDRFNSIMNAFIEELQYKDKWEVNLKIATAMDEVCFYAMLLEKRKHNPDLDKKIAEKLPYDVIDKFTPEVKEELLNPETAKILNATYNNPDITPAKLAEITGLAVSVIKDKITILKTDIVTVSGNKIRFRF